MTQQQSKGDSALQTTQSEEASTAFSPWLFESFHRAEVRDLAWVMTGPGLLAPERWPEGRDRAVDVEALRTRASKAAPRLQELDENPALLTTWLEGVTDHGRLGRYFERLLEFGVRELLGIRELAMNVQVRDAERTLGELDLVFRDGADRPPQHWEATVKFYLCVARNFEESQRPDCFFGTVVEDRLDLKLARLLNRQLPLAQHPQARSQLETYGLADPESRIFLKGLFFYPSDTDWRRHPAPGFLAHDHPRGWWTTHKRMAVPQSSSNSRWIRLGLFRWLSRVQGDVASELLMTRTELERFVARHFEGDPTPELLRRRELTIAEVEVDTNTGTPGRARINEISRGHVVHELWPQLALSVLAESRSIPTQDL